MKNMKRFGLRPTGRWRDGGGAVSSANRVVYEALNSATAFFMSFMLFMVNHVLGSGRRPGCDLCFLCGKTLSYAEGIP